MAYCTASSEAIASCGNKIALFPMIEAGFKTKVAKNGTDSWGSSFTPTMSAYGDVAIIEMLP